MDRANPLPGKRVLLGAGAFLLAMMVIGSLWDFQISKAVYNPDSPFGLFFAGFGEYPAALGFAAAGTMLLSARNRENRLVSILQIIGGCWFILSGAAMAAMLPKGYLNISTGLSVGIGMFCTALTVWGVARLCRGADRHTVIRVAAVFLLVIFADILVVNLIKIPWGRARMRLVAVDDRAYFMPWWQPGKALRDTLVAAGVAAEEFKSFPSGHTANASSLMLLCLLPQLSPKLAGKQGVLFLLGLVWTSLVAASRIVMGAHYLTDTIVGFAVGLMILAGLCHSLLPVQKKREAEHRMQERSGQ